jgi:hypothetical protein
MTYKIKCDRNKVLFDFKITRSYAETGKLNNISRQRVEQIVKKSGIPERVKSPHDMSSWLGKNCKTCNRPLTENNHSRGYCVACKNYLTRKNRTKNSIRSVLYPKECSVCHKDITKKKDRSRGMCIKCYRKWWYHFLPGRKIYMRNYYHNKWENDENWRNKKREANKRYHKIYMEKHKKENKS